MHPIIYDVAASLDGFISGPQEDISKFDFEGPVVDDYNLRMDSYDTTVMGRLTYEFGYQFGLLAGQNPYPSTRTFVFSESLVIDKNSDIEVWSESIERGIEYVRRTAKGPIYLCGGGEFAGSLLSAGYIDRVIIKRAPVVYGSGTPLFGNSGPTMNLSRLKTKTYQNGYLLEEFTR